MTPLLAQADEFEFWFALIVYAIPLLFLLFAFLTGHFVERRHFASIRRREAATAGLPAVPTRSVETGRTVIDARVVLGSIVISHDYFKRFLSRLRKIFGGRIRSYETLLDRGRREAVLRLKEQSGGADVILNLRIATSNIASTRGKKGMGAVEIVAYGTAVRYG